MRQVMEADYVEIGAGALACHSVWSGLRVEEAEKRGSHA